MGKSSERKSVLYCRQCCFSRGTTCRCGVVIYFKEYMEAAKTARASIAWLPTGTYCKCQREYPEERAIYSLK